MINGVISTEEELAEFIARKNGKPLSDPPAYRAPPPPPPPSEPVAAHAKHAPSSADQRRACPGSRRMQELYPESEDSQKSKEGTATHWAIAELLNGGIIDGGLVAPNDIMLTDEMCDCAEMCADVVLADVTEPDDIILVEQRVTMETIHPDVWGTPDYAVYKPSRKRLIITDYKHGQRFVSEFENWQLIEYFEGVFNRLGLNGLNDLDLYVTFRIVQPRCYFGGGPVREWTIKASDLRGYINEARAFEAAAAAPDAPCRVNPHCHDCTARRACPAALRAAASAMDIAESPEPFDLPPEALGVELLYLERAIKILGARYSGLEEQALFAIRHGQVVPNYQAKHGEGRQRWKKPNAEILALGDLMGVPLANVKPITPKQAVDAGLDASLVAAYSERPTGELKLVRNDGALARRVFAIDGSVNTK